MGKRHPNLPRGNGGLPGQSSAPDHLVLHLIAVPLFIVAFLLIVSGVFSLSLVSVAIGVIGIVAALGLQRHGNHLEANEHVDGSVSVDIESGKDRDSLATHGDQFTLAATTASAAV